MMASTQPTNEKTARLWKFKANILLARTASVDTSAKDTSRPKEFSSFRDCMMATKPHLRSSNSSET